MISVVFTLDALLFMSVLSTSVLDDEPELSGAWLLVPS